MSSHLGVIQEMNQISTISAPCMAGKDQGDEAGAAPALADNQVHGHQHCPAEPSVHLALVPARARNSGSCLLVLTPMGRSIPIDTQQL